MGSAPAAKSTAFTWIDVIASHLLTDMSGRETKEKFISKYSSGSQTVPATPTLGERQTFYKIINVSSFLK
jgi:hypothetical protein